MNRKKGKMVSVKVQPFHGSVLELGVQVAPVARVIDQDHRGDGEAAERVQRREPLLLQVHALLLFGIAMAELLHMTGIA